MLMNEYNNMSLKCAEETYKSTNEQLKNFNDYFFDRKYDAYLIDPMTGGNLLYFTLMYSYHKLAWVTGMSDIDADKYKSLSFRL